MMPSCVTYRDQDIATDERKVTYKEWSELRTYINNMAAKDAIREKMDDFEPHLKDGLPIAKELFRRGVISKHSVDMCDSAQFANIPSYTHNHNTFFSSMVRALDDTFENWYHLLEILRGYPELDACTDALVKKYEDNLAEMELEKHMVNPPQASEEEAKVLFESLCDDFETLWQEVLDTLRNHSNVEALKNRLRYVFLDQRDDLENASTLEEIFVLLRTRIDLTNFVLLDSVMNEYPQTDIRSKINKFMRQRAVRCSHFRLRDFVYNIQNNPKFIFTKPGVDMTFQMSTSWSHEDTPAFYYFWLTEIVFCSLTKHQYLHRMTVDEGCGFSFYYATPEWITPSIVKLSRERILSLTLNGVCFCRVLNEITMPNPAWGLTNSDYMDFMSSIVRICRGDIESVVDVLDGRGPRKEWEVMDTDKKYNAYDTLMDDFPKAIPWLPQTITFANFLEFYELNHVWLSHPFYTDMRGFKLVLVVYPRGKGSGKGTHLSVGVCLMAGEQDDMLNFPVRGKIHVRLINQLGDHDHIEAMYHFSDEAREEATARVRDGADFAPLGLCIDQFVPIESLEYTGDTQYLINESLYFQVLQTDFVHRTPRGQ